LLRQSIKKSAGVHDDTTLLVGLEGVVVDRVELDPDGCRVVHVSTAPQAMDAGAVCPSCRTPSTSVKGRVVTYPRDVRLPVASQAKPQARDDTLSTARPFGPPGTTAASRVAGASVPFALKLVFVVL